MAVFYRLVEGCAGGNGNRPIGECPNDLTRARRRFGRYLTKFENKLLTLDRFNAIHYYRGDADERLELGVEIKVLKVLG
jgi:hypothetical protein